MTTKTALKSKIDAIYAEIDLHTDLTETNRASMKREASAAILKALNAIHDTIPGMSKARRQANAEFRAKVKV